MQLNENSKSAYPKLSRVRYYLNGFVVEIKLRKIWIEEKIFMDSSPTKPHLNHIPNQSAVNIKFLLFICRPIDIFHENSSSTHGELLGILAEKSVGSSNNFMRAMQMTIQRQQRLVVVVPNRRAN